MATSQITLDTLLQTVLDADASQLVAALQALVAALAMEDTVTKNVYADKIAAANIMTKTAMLDAIRQRIKANTPPKPAKVAGGAKRATHAEMGEEYLKRHGDDTIYARSQWYKYDSGVWQPTDEYNVNKEIWAVQKDFERVQRCDPSTPIRNSIRGYVCDYLSVPDKGMDAWPTLINLRNGVYNLEQEILLPHSPHWYLTTQLPFDYDPQNPPPPHPLWKRYRESTFVLPRSNNYDDETDDLVQEAIGYSLTTDVGYHMSFWCMGEGRNGKGVLFHMLSQLGGESATAVNINLLKEDRYQLADLIGKRIALCSELNIADSVLTEDGTLKQLIAGDAMRVRQIKERGEIMYPTAKFWLSGNRLPAVPDTSHGFWERVRVIPFNRQFSDREIDRTLKDVLAREALPAIFHYSLGGLRRLRTNGRFTLPKQVAEATAQFRRESNTIGMFVEETYENWADMANEMLAKGQTPPPISAWQEPISTAYSEYRAWAMTNGYKPYSARNFKTEMEALGFLQKRSTKARYYEGIRKASP